MKERERLGLLQQELNKGKVLCISREAKVLFLGSASRCHSEMC